MDQFFLDDLVHNVSVFEIIQNHPIITILLFLISFYLGIDNLLNPHSREEEIRWKAYYDFRGERRRIPRVLEIRARYNQTTNIRPIFVYVHESESIRPHIALNPYYRYSHSPINGQSRAGAYTTGLYRTSSHTVVVKIPAIIPVNNVTLVSYGVPVQYTPDGCMLVFIDRSTIPYVQ